MVTSGTLKGGFSHTFQRDHRGQRKQVWLQAQMLNWSSSDLVQGPSPSPMQHHLTASSNPPLQERKPWNQESQWLSFSASEGHSRVPGAWRRQLLPRQLLVDHFNFHSAPS